MGKSYSTAAAFRMALEERLKTLHAESGVPLQSLRLKLVIERLLARLFAASNPPWLLKGGYAMELRYRPRARTTKDIDLSVKTLATTLAERMKQVRDEMQAAADQELGDFFVFRIGEPTTELQGAPDGGARFPVNALLAGKTFARFHLDVGFGDLVLSAPEKLVGQDFLGFAGIAPARAIAIPKAQQFAEKIHAYSKPWSDRSNTRTKDLVDLVLLLTVNPPSADAIRGAVEQTFEKRGTHSIPDELPSPPDEWRPVYDEMAAEANLEPRQMDEGFQLLSAYWQSLAKVT
jgi:hypothetical protein